MNIQDRFLRAARQCRYLSEDLIEMDAPRAYVETAHRYAHGLLSMCEDLEAWMSGEHIVEEINELIERQRNKD